MTTDIENKWVRVYFSADCDEDGNCPHCHIDYSDCECPGPTQDDEFEYDEDDAGNLIARRLPPTDEEDER